LNPEKPPQTLSELESFATKISDAEKGERKYGFALPMGEEWGGMVQPMEASNSYSGVYYYNFKTGLYDLSVYKPWLETFKALKENGGLFPGMASMKDDLATAQFAEGNIGMMYAASWKLSLFSEQYPPINEWGVAMPPAIDETNIGKGAVMISAAGLNVVKRGTIHLKEAVKVWQFLYSQDYLGHLYKSGSIIPVMNGIIENPAYMPAVANFKAFLPSSKDSLYPDTPLIMDEWSRSKAYVSGISGDQTLDKVLSEESNRLNNLWNIQFSSFGMNKNDYYFPSFDPLHPLKK
jgi:multiple sugar transport system substrate-binding protein